MYAKTEPQPYAVCCTLRLSRLRRGPINLFFLPRRSKQNHDKSVRDPICGITMAFGLGVVKSSPERRIVLQPEQNRLERC